MTHDGGEKLYCLCLPRSTRGLLTTETESRVAPRGTATHSGTRDRVPVVTSAPLLEVPKYSPQHAATLT